MQEAENKLIRLGNKMKTLQGRTIISYIVAISLLVVFHSTVGISAAVIKDEIESGSSLETAENCYLVSDGAVTCFVSRESTRVNLFNEKLPIVQQLNSEIDESDPIAVIALGGSGGKGSDSSNLLTLVDGGKGGVGGVALSVTTLANTNDLVYYIGSQGTSGQVYGGQGHETDGGSGGASSLAAEFPFPEIESETHVPSNLIAVAGGGGGGGSGHAWIGPGHGGGYGGTAIASIDGDATANGNNGHGQKPGEGGEGAEGGGGRRDCEEGSGGIGGRGGSGTNQAETTWQVESLPFEGPWGRGGNCYDGAGGGGGYGGGGAAGDANTLKEKASGAGGGGSYARKFTGVDGYASNNYQLAFEEALTAYLEDYPELNGPDGRQEGAVAVVFSRHFPKLSIRSMGDGYVILRDTQGNELCNTGNTGECEATVDYDDVVLAEAIADEIAEFAGWDNSDCGAEEFCEMVIEAGSHFTANFSTPMTTITINDVGGGIVSLLESVTWRTGSVEGGPVSSPISVPRRIGNFALEAHHEDPIYQSVQWSGDCENIINGIENSCEINPESSPQQTIEAQFTYFDTAPRLYKVSDKSTFLTGTTREVPLFLPEQTKQTSFEWITSPDGALASVTADEAFTVQIIEGYEMELYIETLIASIDRWDISISAEVTGDFIDVYGNSHPDDVVPRSIMYDAQTQSIVITFRVDWLGTGNGYDMSDLTLVLEVDDI